MMLAPLTHLCEALRYRAQIAEALNQITRADTLRTLCTTVVTALENEPKEPQPRGEDAIDTLAGLAVLCAYRVRDVEAVRKAAMILANAYDKQLKEERA